MRQLRGSVRNVMSNSARYHFLQHLMDHINNLVVVSDKHRLCFGGTFCKTQRKEEVNPTYVSRPPSSSLQTEEFECVLRRDVGLWLGFGSQHLSISSIKPSNPSGLGNPLLNSSVEGRSPCGIFNRTRLETTSADMDDFFNSI